MQTPTATNKPVRVSLIEDNAKIREGLSILIGGTPEFQFVSGHSTAEEALKQIPQLKPDVVLVDINLPGMSGIQCVRLLRDQMPALKIIMHTVYEDREQLFNALRAGANGYLLKRTPPGKLMEAIAEVHNGYAPMSGQIARMVVDFFHQNDPAGKTQALTPREGEILDLLAKGYRYKEIADALGIGFATVRTHLRNIYEKLHVSSRTEAVVKYLKQ